MKISKSLKLILLVCLLSVPALAQKATDLNKLRSWKGQLPLEISGNRKHIVTKNFFQLPEIRQSISSLLGKEFLSNFAAGEFLVNPIELVDGALFIDIATSKNLTHDEYELFVIVKLDEPSFHAAYYYPSTNKIVWKHSIGASIKDVPQTIEQKVNKAAY